MRYECVASSGARTMTPVAPVGQTIAPEASRTSTRDTICVPVGIIRCVERDARVDLSACGTLCLPTAFAPCLHFREDCHLGGGSYIWIHRADGRKPHLITKSVSHSIRP